MLCVSNLRELTNMFVFSLFVLIFVIYFVSNILITNEDYTYIKRSKSIKIEKIMTSEYEKELVQKYKYEFSYKLEIKNNETGNTNSITNTFSVFPTK